MRERDGEWSGKVLRPPIACVTYGGNMSATDATPPKAGTSQTIHVVFPATLVSRAFTRADATGYPSLSEYIRQLVRDDIYPKEKR